MTPLRRAVDPSIDSVSVDESFETPIGSRASTKSGRTPSMGNKLELDARRSERNMRNNALHQEQQDQHKKGSSPVRMHARFIFGGSSGDMDPNEAQYYHASSSDPARNMSEENSGPPARIASEDSITISLRSASDNMEKLRALLGEIESDNEKQREEEIVDAFTTASSPRKHRSLSRKGKARAMRSDSPPPEVSSSRSLPPTPVIEPVKFCPTSARDNASPNRFQVLEVEVEVVSSPASDDTTTELPTAHTQYHSKENRLGSGGTLDQTLEMLSSPGSGYKADDSSDVHTPGSGKEKQTPPSGAGLIWPATDASPLMRIVVGPQTCVMTVVVRAKERFVIDM